MQENSCKSANKRMMVMPHNFYDNYESQLLLSSVSASASHNFYNNYESQLLLSSASASSSFSSSCEKTGRSDCGFDIGGDGGSMFCNTSSQVDCMSDIYEYDVVGASGSGSCTNNSAAAVLVSNSLSPSSITDSLVFFNSSSGEMAAASVNVRVPFTATQLQELERQTLIYKYMLASAPIPSELLLPITKSRSRVPPYQPNMVQGSTELRLLSNNSSVAEPWRCRRTDGKKWRCSRDVAPDQKYCERHSHKTRHRSRKPVELHAHRINNNNNQSVNILNKSYAKSHFLNQNMASSIASSEQQQPWSLERFIKGETMHDASNSNHQEWLQNTSNYGDHHREHLINSNSYTNLGGDNLAFQAQRLLDQYSLFLRPKMVSHQAQPQETRHFIDAWSIRGGNMANENGIGSNCFVSQNEKLPISSLTLSMSGGRETIERNEKVSIGSLGTMGAERKCAGTLRPHRMNHDSGMSSPPGGPLAEALCLGIASSSAKSDSNVASSHEAAPAPLPVAKSYVDVVP